VKPEAVREILLEAFSSNAGPLLYEAISFILAEEKVKAHDVLRRPNALADALFRAGGAVVAIESREKVFAEIYESARKVE
jgi:hypothetical protein